MKVIDFPKRFIAHLPEEKKKFYHLSEHFWDTQYKNDFFLFIKKLLIHYWSAKSLMYERVKTSDVSFVSFQTKSSIKVKKSREQKGSVALN